MTETSPGSPRREGRGFVLSFGSKRICEAPGCPTKLSRYNESTRCSVHAEGTRRP